MEERQSKVSKIQLHDYVRSSLPPTVVVINREDEVLGNELILDIILRKFEDSETNELKNCRLVCKKWNRLATNIFQHKYWKNRVFLVFSGNNPLENYTSSSIFPNVNDQFFSCFTLERKISSPRTYNRMRSTPNLTRSKTCRILAAFFAKQNQYIKSLNLNIELETTQLEMILNSQSTSLLELKISFVPSMFYNFEKVKPAVGQQKNKVEPNQLVNLNYLCFKLPFRYDWNENPELSAELFQMMEVVLSKIPQGKKMKLCLLEWGKMCDTFVLLQKYDQIKNLEVLEVCKHSHSSFPILNVLSFRIKLKFFSIEQFAVENKFDASEETYKFLCTQSSSLEMLSWGSELNFKFPWKMPLLLKLRLRCRAYTEQGQEEADFEHDPDPDDLPIGNREKEWIRNCRPIFYEQIFPNLKELELQMQSESVKIHLIPERFLSRVLPPQSPCNSLRKLTIEYLGINMEMMQRISVTFPCIKTLVIKDLKKHMSGQKDEREFYNVLWNSEFAPVLEILSLESSFNTLKGVSLDKYFLDSIFSNVSEKRIREITESKSLCGENIAVTTEIESGSGSILNMKRLKILEINPKANAIRSQSHKHKFTDFSAHFLFGKLESLEFLRLDRTQHHFSVYARAATNLNVKLSTPIPAQLRFFNDADPIDKAFETDFNSKGFDSITV